jgi:hypothetical protein
MKTESDISRSDQNFDDDEVSPGISSIRSSHHQLRLSKTATG